MGIELILVEARGVVLDDAAVETIAQTLGLPESVNEWERDDELNRALQTAGWSLERARDTWSGEVNVPYLTLTRFTKVRYPRQMAAGIYARGGEVTQLTVAEQEALDGVLAGTTYAGA